MSDQLADDPNTLSALVEEAEQSDDPQAPGALDDDTGPDMDHAGLLKHWIGCTNVADELDDTNLGQIGQRVYIEYEIDLMTTADYRAKYAKWMEVAMQVTKEKTYPWPKASNVIYPLMTTSALQFAARAYPAVIKNRDVVRGTVVGQDQSEDKKRRAERIGDHMSWQLLDQMPEWESDTDMLLHVLPIVGCMFRKTYFDPDEGRNVSELVPADRLIINYKAKSMERVPRKTEEIELYPIEVEERILAGIFLPHDYGRASLDTSDNDAPIEFLEQHRRLDLDGDGYAEPWVVTICKQTQQVARIVAAFDLDGVKFSAVDHTIRRIEPVPYYTRYSFLPAPDGSIYSLGFGHYLFPLNEAINTTLNLMLDAGHLQNTGGGFIGKGLSMNAGAVRFQPGEYKSVNVTGATIRDSVFPLPFQGPNPVLFELLGFLVAAGKEVASVKDVMLGENMPANMPATTILALIEQGMQVFSAIYKRVHRSLKSEFAKLYRLNRLYLDYENEYAVGDEWRTITSADYQKNTGVEPVSDPKMVSDMQRLGKAQFLLQFRSDPHCNPIEILERVFDAAWIDAPEKIINQKPMPDPKLALSMAEMAQRKMHEEAQLQIRQSRDKASEVKDLAQAVLYLAQAEKAANDQHLGWISQQLDFMRLKLDQLNGPGADVDGILSGADGNAAPANGGLPGMAPPPGNQGNVPLPGGLPGAAPAGMPG